MTAPPAAIERVVETALGCSVRSCELPGNGRMAATYVLELDGTPARAVCKVGGPSVRTGDVVEPLVLRLVGRTTSLPVPAVLASGALRDGHRRTRWGLYEFREGTTPAQYDELTLPVRRQVVSEVGEILGQLHGSHQFERTGGVAAADGQLRVRDPRGFDFPERGRRLLRSYPGLEDLQPVLTHGDLFPGNLLVDDAGRITALLDWGNAHVTTAGYALSRAEMRFIDWFRFPARESERLRTALRTGYRRHRSLPPDYPEFGSFYKLLWLAQSGERHLRHTVTSRGRRQLRQHLRSLLPSTIAP
ncbi:MAG: aminoglycoside phosphotransferase family protein [Halovenus sp.]